METMDPPALMTLEKEVKFSEAMSSIPRHWRRFSFSMRSWISGSTSTSEVFPQDETESMVEEEEIANAARKERIGRVVQRKLAIEAGFKGKERIGRGSHDWRIETTSLAAVILIRDNKVEALAFFSSTLYLSCLLQLWYGY